MSGLLLACDIDRTLIYSHRYPHAGWDCVEWIGDREQAFISPGTRRRLETLPEHLDMVRVTSRSLEQYRRLRLPGRAVPALTANGADLVLDGSPDPDWRAETEALIAPWRGELERGLARWGQSPDLTAVRVIDGAYLFLHCAEGVDPARRAAELAEMTSLKVVAAGRKLYLLPPPLDKGTAVSRWMKRLGVARCAAAGDSAMDLPMLRLANYPIAPMALGKALPDRAILCPEDRLLSEFALETAAALWSALENKV